MSWKAQERRAGQTPEQRQAGYDRWRRGIPFTDEEIAAQLDADAEALEATGDRGDAWLAKSRRWNASQARKGRLTREGLGLALDALVKTCAVCGKKALYRLGTFGRCSAHRHVLEPEVERSKAIKNARGTAIAAAFAEEDRNHRVVDKLRAKDTKRHGRWRARH